ncbi:MAG: XRE family transcriptional regulator [Stigonema ocellatum SAG 48.90 = DSM 106950]|nr:XRE family transcriptional regulator [Stigonema ocellatum SAG 48.90 = DSM 106950]
MKEEIECYEGSGNVFADIGLKDADELFARAQIGVEVLKILKDRKLKQREIGELLGIKQTEVSHLVNGRFSRFSEGKLLAFLKKLDRKVMLVINQEDNTHGISLSL